MMRFAGVLLLLCLLLAGCAELAPNTVARPDQLSFPALQFHFPQVDKQQLANGMHLYLKEDHELPLVELTVMVGGGSLRDPLDKTGLSEFLAAALKTGGAGSFSAAAFETELEQRAIELSVTSSAYGYRIDMSLQSQDLTFGLEILTALLRTPRFDTERLELARQQMLDEIRRQNDDPEGIASRLLAAAVNPGHPFGMSPTRQTVEALTRQNLLQLHRRYFRPDNVWIAASGAFDSREFVNLLEQDCADWTAPPTMLSALPPLPAEPPGKILVADKDIPQTNIMMGHTGIDKDNPDLYALRVANYILGGGGFNSRMMREIRSDRGLAYSVYSYFQIGRRLPELFIAGSETKAESTVEVVQLMRRLIEQMTKQPVTPAELELAKQSLINSFVFAFTDTHSVVSRKLRLDYFDYPPQYLENYRARIAAVTIDDVQRVAKKYFRPEQLQIVLVGDSEKFLPGLKGLQLPLVTVDLANEQ